MHPQNQQMVGRRKISTRVRLAASARSPPPIYTHPRSVRPRRPPNSCMELPKPQSWICSVRVKSVSQNLLGLTVYAFLPVGLYRIR